jgi:hypothetical protein
MRIPRTRGAVGVIRLPVDLSRADPKVLLELYAESLVSRAFGLTLVAKSRRGCDAVDPSGTRYQIKRRRQTRHNSSRQLGVFRNLECGPFDYTIASFRVRLEHRDIELAKASRVSNDLEPRDLAVRERERQYSRKLGARRED